MGSKNLLAEPICIAKFLLNIRISSICQFGTLNFNSVHKKDVCTSSQCTGWFKIKPIRARKITSSFVIDFGITTNFVSLKIGGKKPSPILPPEVSKFDPQPPRTHTSFLLSSGQSIKTRATQNYNSLSASGYRNSPGAQPWICRKRSLKNYAKQKRRMPLGNESIHTMQTLTQKGGKKCRRANGKRTHVAERISFGWLLDSICRSRFHLHQPDDKYVFHCTYADFLRAWVLLTFAAVLLVDPVEWKSMVEDILPTRCRVAYFIN